MTVVPAHKLAMVHPTVVTLVLHDCYNVVPLLLHCCYTTATLVVHCYQISQQVRSLCLKSGVQLLCRDYDFTVANSVTLDDVLDLFPIVKSELPVSRDAMALLEAGKAFLTQGRLQPAYTYLNRALGAHNSIYGPMHEDSAAVYTTLATTCYHAGDFAQALEHQHRALVIVEKVNIFLFFFLSRLPNLKENQNKQNIEFYILVTP